MNHPLYVGIAGRRSSGKDTVAAHLCHQYGAARIALADELKRRCQYLFELEWESLYGPSDARERPIGIQTQRPRWWAGVWSRWSAESLWSDLFVDSPVAVPFHGLQTTAQRVFARVCSSDPVTPRVILQTLGTEYGRTLWPDVWLHAWEREAKRALAGPPKPHPFVVCSDVRFPNEAEMILKLGGRVLWLDASERLGPNLDTHSSETSLEGSRKALGLIDIPANGAVVDTLWAVSNALGLPSR